MSDQASREYFRTRIGFILAAAGSAVGLGNMWRFPYQAAEGGGAAFVVLYLLMTFLVGVPIMASEFLIGRKTGLSPIGAYRRLGGRYWIAAGGLAIVAPLVILCYFSVITGWTLLYVLDALTGFAPDPAARFAEISTGNLAIVCHLLVMTITVLVVMRGVRNGIERASLILMPALLVLLIGLVVWAATLSGSSRGYEFYLRPSLSALADPDVFRQAAAQAFLSLSVGMGIMITYASYLDRRYNLGREAITVSLTDFSVAFVGGLVVFPVVFALGLSDQVGESAIGALFISIPAAFVEMGVVGQVVGFTFFVALLVAGLTSLISLLEVSVSSLVDETGLERGKCTLLAGLIAGALGVAPALSQSALGMMDKIAGEGLVVAGALASLLLAGWVVKDPLVELQEGASAIMRKFLTLLLILIRYVAPVVVAIVLFFSIRELARMFYQ